jgi:hypothetical protein
MAAAGATAENKVPAERAAARRRLEILMAHFLVSDEATMTRSP